MSKITYIVNNTVMELYDNVEIKINAVIDDLSNPEKRSTTKSFQLQIPRTAVNLNALGITLANGATGIFNPIQNRSLLIADNISIIDGYTEIDSINKTDITVIIYSRFIDFLDATNQKTLQELTSFGFSPFDYENTIREHVNRNYQNGDIIQEVPLLSSARQVSTGDSWTYSTTPTVTTSTNSTILQLRFKAVEGITYTFSFTALDITETGTFTYTFGFYNNTTLVGSTTSVNVTPGTSQTSSFSLTAGAGVTHLGVHLVGSGGTVTLSMSNITQTNPVQTRVVRHQFPFIMYERMYAPKYVVDSFFRGQGPSYTAGSERSVSQDTQAAQFLMLGDIQGNAANGDVSNWPVNFMEFGSFPPAVYLTQIITAICQENGWQISGSLMQDAEFKKLIVPYTGDGKAWQTAIIDDYDASDAALDLFEASRITSDQSSSAQDTGTLFIADPSQVTWAPILFNFEDSDPNANYNPANGKYTFSADYRTQFSMQIVGEYQILNGNQRFVSWRIRSSLKGVIAEHLLRPSPFILFRPVNKLLQTTVLDFVTGEEVWCEMAMYGTQDISGTMRTKIDSRFYNTIVGAPSQDNALLNVTAFLPKMKQLEFLKEFVLKPFNAYLNIDEINRTVYLEAYPQFILPNTLALDLSKKLLDTNYKIESIISEHQSINLNFAENSSDDVPFLPNNYKMRLDPATYEYGGDYATMLRFRRKEVRVNNVVYANNSIFNRTGGVKDIQLQLAPTNYRKFTYYQTRDFSGDNLSTNYPYEVILPVISSYDSMTQEWFFETPEGNDARPFAQDMNYGSGLRLLKYDGHAQWIWLGVPSDVYYVYLGDPGFASTSGAAMQYKMYMGMTSFLDPNVILTDDNYDSYFQTNQWSLTESTLNLGVNSAFSYTNVNDPTQPIVGWQYNDNGSLLQVSNDLYNKYYKPKYEQLSDSNYLYADFRIDGVDYQKLKSGKTPVIVFGELYTVQEIINYQVLTGFISLKLRKKLN